MSTPVVTVETGMPVTVTVSTPSEVRVVHLYTAGPQGPPGPPGPPGEPGPAGDANGAFLVNNRFNEIAEDEIAKVQARLNLGVQNIDGGTFN